MKKKLLFLSWRQHIPNTNTNLENHIATDTLSQQKSIDLKYKTAEKPKKNYKNELVKSMIKESRNIVNKPILTESGSINQNIKFKVLNTSKLKNKTKKNSILQPKISKLSNGKKCK